MSSFTFQRLQCLQSFTLSKDYNVFIYISNQKTKMSSIIFKKTSMYSVIYAFKWLQCLHLHFKRLQCLQSFTLSKDYNVFIYISKDFNVFSHLCFQKATISSFIFPRLQCLQSFMLSKDHNVFIYISKTSMPSVIYTFKRLQCLHLHFKDINLFSHLRF